MLYLKLSQTNWSELYPIEDVNLCYDEFLCTFSAMYNKSFPIEKVKIKMNHNVHKPWITHGIIVSINNKHRLYKIRIKKYLTSYSKLQNI